MADDTDTLAQLATEVANALAPLTAALAEPENFGTLAAELGWTLDDIPTPISAVGTALSDLATLLESGIDASSASSAVGAIRAVVQAVQAIANQPPSAFPATVDPVIFAAEFPTQLVDFLIVDYLMSQHPPWGQVLHLLGVIRLEDVAAAGSRPGVHPPGHRLERSGPGAQRSHRRLHRRLGMGRRELRPGRLLQRGPGPAGADWAGRPLGAAGPGDARRAVGRQPRAGRHPRLGASRADRRRRPRRLRGRARGRPVHGARPRCRPARLRRPALRERQYCDLTQPD